MPQKVEYLETFPFAFNAPWFEIASLDESQTNNKIPQPRRNLSSLLEKTEVVYSALFMQASRYVPHLSPSVIDFRFSRDFCLLLLVLLLIWCLPVIAASLTALRTPPTLRGKQGLLEISDTLHHGVLKTNITEMSTLSFLLFFFR